jgi:hypothetical protein
MKRVVMRANVDGASTALGVYEQFDAAWEAVLENGWIPKGATYRIAGAADYPEQKEQLDGQAEPPGIAAFIVEHGNEEFVLVIMMAAP